MIFGIFAVTQTIYTQSVPKYYILFDNFEDQKDGKGTTITNLIDICYSDVLKNNFFIGKYFERAPFSAATFNKRAITEYDCAIFLMGVQHGLDAVVDGIKVIDKIYEMRNAGKSVIIIGNQVLAKGFAGSDPKIKSFLKDTLGIIFPLSNNYLIQGRVNLNDGQNLWGGKLSGPDFDPVSKGYKKVFNMIYQENNVGPFPPIRFFGDIEVFGLENWSKSIAIDKVVKINNDSTNVEKEKMYVGIRYDQGPARVILWSQLFDNITGVHLVHANTALTNAVNWSTRDYIKPEKYTKLIDDAIDFGKVDPNYSAYETVTFQNFGRTTLNVSNIEIEPQVVDSIFQIIEGDEPVTLQPMDMHTVKVMFKPKSLTYYQESMLISSDATNGDVSVILTGTGGTTTEFGPRISVASAPILFGNVPYGEMATKNIGIFNPGNQDLTVNSIKFIKDANEFFFFTKSMTYPIVIAPGQTYNYGVTFNQQDTNGGTFLGEMLITSNAVNDGGEATVYLNAYGNPKNIKSGLTLSTKQYDFGDVIIGETGVFELTITNSSNVDVIFPNPPVFLGGGEVKAQYSFLDGTQAIPKLAPSASHILKVGFKPQAEKTYPIILRVISSDPKDQLVDISLTGTGKVDGGIDDSYFDNKLSMKINPNVSNGNAILYCNYKGNEGKISNIYILDITGNKVAEIYQGNVIMGLHIINLGTLNLSSGRYFAVFEMDNHIKTTDFIINK